MEPGTLLVATAAVELGKKMSLLQCVMVCMMVNTNKSQKTLGLPQANKHLDLVTPEAAEMFA